MPNTFANLTPLIQASALNAVGNKLAFLNDFITDFSSEYVDYRKATVNVPVMTGSTAVLNPTTFGGGSNTAVLAPITMNHISVPFYLSNAEYQNGYKLEQLIATNVQILADEIQKQAFTPITTVNYGTAVTVTQASFALANLQTAWASIKGSRKVAYLDSVSFSKLLTNVTTQIDPELGVPYAGFQKVAYADSYTGAGTNIYGFVSSDRKGLVMASAKAAIAPKTAAGIETIEIDLGNGLFADLNMWGNTSDRSDNASLDIYFGAAAGDKTALKVIKSA